MIERKKGEGMGKRVMGEEMSAEKGRVEQQ